MKNFYHLILKGNTRFISRISLVMLLSIFASTAFGQITWKATVDDDASKPENWDPVGDYMNQSLTLDTAFTTVWPRFTADREDTIPGLAMSGLSEIIIAKPDGRTFQLMVDNYYMPAHTTIRVESGKFRTKNSRNFYLEDSLAYVIITGTGYFHNPHLTAMGKVGTSRGGRIEIHDDGTFETNDMIRFLADTTKSIVQITENGKMIVHKDYRDEFKYRIQTGQIRSDDDHDIAIDYDIATTTMTLTARSKDVLVAGPGEQQNILANDEMAMAYALDNRGYQELSNVEWKYSTTSGSGYQSFGTPLMGDTVEFTFPDPGTYYVVFEGTKPDNSVVTSSEVVVVVAPSYVKLDLIGEQNLRPKQIGATISCVDQVSITSREWKVSTTQGSGYMSFPTPVTGLEYTPSFDTAAVYFVVCEYVYNGMTYQTKEVMINVANHSFPIEWNGSVSDDAGDIRNWTPMAHVQWMTLNIPATSTVWPHLRGSDNDTINDFYGGKLFVEKDDTAKVSFRKNGWYLNSEMVVNSGTVYLRQTRLDNGNAIITVNNDAMVVLAESWFIMGNSSTPTNGGRVNLSGNAVFFLESATANDVWRWVTNNDSLSSVYITDNAVFKMTGNYFNNYSSLVETGDIFTDDGLEVVVNYNEVDSITSIYTRNASSFGLADYTNLVTGVGIPAPELSTINDESIYTYNWKYTTTPGSGYMSFDPPQTDSVCSPVFDMPGLYFVVCQGYDSMAYSTTDEVQVLAVSVEIAPQDTQYLEALQEGNMLTVTESTPADTREWKISSTSGSAYEAIFPPVTGMNYTPLSTENGIFYIVCESMVQGTAILSNEVVIEVGTTGLDDLNTSSFQLYPNPSNGRFFVTMPQTGDYNLSVIDLTGKTVLNRSYQNSMGLEEISIDRKGIFIVKLQTEESTFAKKIIVK